MPYTVYASNRPEEPLEVDDGELINLSRLGLLVAGKGDISANGTLKRAVAADAPTETITATTPVQKEN